MKRLIVFSMACSLVACSSSVVPDSIREQTEELIRRESEDIMTDACAYEITDTIGEIIWKENTSKKEDTTIYFFDIEWELNGLPYPEKYRVHTVADSIVDIQKESFRLLEAGLWQSIFPPVFDPTKEDWWVDISDLPELEKVQFDDRQYIDVDSASWTCREQFTGNVELKYPKLILRCDTLVWDMIENQLLTDDFRLYGLDSLSQDTTYVMLGNGLIAEPSFSYYEIRRVKSEFRMVTN